MIRTVTVHRSPHHHSRRDDLLPEPAQPVSSPCWTNCSARTALRATSPPEVPDAGYPLRPFAAAVTAGRPGHHRAPYRRVAGRSGSTAERWRRRPGAGSAEAIQRYRELLAVEPGHVAARNNLSALLETTGDPAEALDQLSQALRVAPDDVNMLVSRGAIHGRLKQYARGRDRPPARPPPRPPSMSRATSRSGWCCGGRACPGRRRRRSAAPSRSSRTTPPATTTWARR